MYLKNCGPMYRCSWSLTMFNRNAFNRLPFNRPYVLEVYLTINLNGVGGLTAKTKVEFTSKAKMSGVGTMTAAGIRELSFSAHMDGEGELLTVKINKEMFPKIVLAGIGTLAANIKKYHVDSIVFSGDFAPGDRIVLDSKELTAIKNGVSILDEIEGDFFDLVLGTNAIKYTDSESGRSVLVRITHRDKFV
ncbi:hypothetical protein D3C73_703300 [compost metagenome]